MIAAIHQPDFLPYPGYFYKILKSDVFVFLDDAQFSNEGWHNFNRIKTPQGALRVKVPVKQTLGDRINGIQTRDDLQWKSKILKTIALNYKRAPFFSRVYPALEELLNPAYKNLALMNETIIRGFCETSGITPGKFIRSSDLKISSEKEQRVIDICKAVGADCYYSGRGASAYQHEDHFTSQGVRLVYSDYKPFSYPQLWGGFIENLSIIDFYLNCGFNLNEMMIQRE